MNDMTTTATSYARAGTPRFPAIDTLHALISSTGRRLSFLPPLVTRIVLGMAFFQAGLGKWRHLDGTTEFFAGIGIPMPGANAVFVALVEMVGGALLIPGIASRVGSFFLAATMIVALVTADRADFLASWSWSGDLAPTDITAFTFLLLLAWLLVSGPGAASADRLLGPWLSRRMSGR